MVLSIPKRLATSCRRTPERAARLERLPYTLRDLERSWSLALGPPFDGDEVSCSWVAPVTRADGTSAVLKLGMPHVEGEHENGEKDTAIDQVHPQASTNSRAG